MVFYDLRSLIWGSGENCTVVQGIASQPSNVFLKAPSRHFRRSETVRMKFEGGIYGPQAVGLEGRGGRGGAYSIAYGPPMGLTHH